MKSILKLLSSILISGFGISFVFAADMVIPGDVIPGFNCAEAGLNIVEKSVCENEVLAYLDNQLSVLYKMTGKKMDIKNEQIKWLKSRNKCSENTDCIAERYIRRIGELTKSVYGNEKPQVVLNPLLGFLQNFYGGVDEEIRIDIPLDLDRNRYRCSVMDVDLNDDGRNEIRCYESCPSYTCPSMTFFQDKSRWKILDFGGLTDRVSISVAAVIPDEVSDKYKVQNNKVNGWKVIEAVYVGQGLPPGKQQITYYIYSGERYSEVVTLIKDWGK